MTLWEREARQAHVFASTLPGEMFRSARMRSRDVLIALRRKLSQGARDKPSAGFRVL
jgi:hypothetical protein